ncbi:MAG: M48 family metallopeptidase [Ignavibacteriaceae bacterium]|nr:M48 family metallopeptidase [Ignavibacteriaceae bacterium]
MPVVKTTSLTLGERVIKCIYKSNRKIRRVSLKITQFGVVELLIPPRYSIATADNFLQANLSLIRKHIDKIISPVTERSLFGQAIRIVTIPGKFKSRSRYRFSENVLTVEVHPSVDLDEEYLYKQLLKIKAKEVILPLAEEMAKRYGFLPKRIQLGYGTTQWGSCTTTGVVRLNSLLASLPLEIIEYVIIHEFCHLKYMNHSNEFWNEVEKYIPHYKTLRKKLKGKAA